MKKNCLTEIIAFTACVDDECQRLGAGSASLWKSLIHDGEMSECWQLMVIKEILGVRKIRFWKWKRSQNGWQMNFPRDFPSWKYLKQASSIWPAFPIYLARCILFMFASLIINLGHNKCILIALCFSFRRNKMFHLVLKHLVFGKILWIFKFIIDEFLLPLFFDLTPLLPSIYNSTASR